MMKREITCEPCAGFWMQVVAAPKEHVRVVAGKLRGECICDGCGTKLGQGAVVRAITVWADGNPNPWRPWESTMLHETKVLRGGDAKPLSVYLASSWRNAMQPGVCHILRRCGIEVYDFRNPHHPKRGGGGFAWSDIDPAWKTWSVDAFTKALTHPLAKEGFALDFNAMRQADACVLLLPCGRSAHLEAGWFWGQGRPVFILTQDGEEPELMYRGATGIFSDVFDVAIALGGKEPK